MVEAVDEQDNLKNEALGAAPAIHEAAEATAKIVMQEILHESSLKGYQVIYSCLDWSGTGAAKQDMEIEEAAQTDIELGQTSYSPQLPGQRARQE